MNGNFASLKFLMIRARNNIGYSFVFPMEPENGA